MTDRDRPLAPCSACKRHVAGEPVCPFCGATLAIAPAIVPTLPGRFSRAAVFAGATLAGCWTNSPASEQTSVTTTSTSTASGSATHDPARARLVGQELAVTGPVAGGIVTLVAQDGSDGGRRSARTDAQGYFVFEDLAPGDYVLAGGTVQEPLHLDAGTTHRDLVLPGPQQHRHRAPNMPYGAPPARYRIV